MRKIFEYIKKWYRREQCYSMMETKGIAAFKCCSGLPGGDASTNNFAYKCYLECKYFVKPPPPCTSCYSYKPDQLCIYAPACGIDRALYTPKGIM